jgi:hypothetical protein
VDKKPTQVILIAKRDEYETPLAVCDTVEEAVRYTGMHRSNFVKTRRKKPGYQKGYVIEWVTIT